MIHAYLLLVLQSDEVPMSVLHIQYPEWPDHGVPGDTVAVREIFKRIHHIPPNIGPIVVHCRLSSCLWLAFSCITFGKSFINVCLTRIICLAQCRYWEDWSILHNSQYHPKNSGGRHVCFKSCENHNYF